MAQAIGHFAFGVGATYLLVVVTGRPATPDTRWLLGLVGGLWALLPDIHWFLPFGRAFHRSRWSTLFWFHHQLDLVATRDNARLLSIPLLGFMFVAATALWWVNSNRESA
jgi:hypothetical protein